MIKELINEYKPDAVSPPGATLAETIKTLGMSQAQLARRMGRPIKTINEIIKAKAAITPETAIQLERVLDIPAGFWLNRELHYRDYLARVRERAKLKTSVQWLKKMPLKRMLKLRWVTKKEDEADQLDVLLRFFGVASPTAWEKCWLSYASVFRKSAVFKTDEAALAAWLRQGDLQALAMDKADFSRASFESTLEDVRRLTAKSPKTAIREAEKLCARAGVAVVFTPELPGTHVSGATRWLAPEKPLIQLSLRYKTDDQLWFTFFHEAAHILLHGKETRIEWDGIDEIREHEANQFATQFLIPTEHYEKLIMSRPIGAKTILQFARDLGIAPGIVVGRLQHDHVIPFRHLNKLKRRLDWSEVVSR